MKRWEKYGTIRHKLYLSDGGTEAGTLYFGGSGSCYFQIYIGGGSDEIVLTADTLEGAKREAEKWLAERYKKDIEMHERCIKALHENVDSLESEGEQG